MPRLTHTHNETELDALDYCRSRQEYHMDMLRRWTEAEHAAVDCNAGVTRPAIATLAIRQAEKEEERDNV